MNPCIDVEGGSFDEGLPCLEGLVRSAPPKADRREARKRSGPRKGRIVVEGRRMPTAQKGSGCGEESVD